MRSDPDFKVRLTEKLEFPRAVLSLLQETNLFNDMVEKAIGDIDEAIKLLSNK